MNVCHMHAGLVQVSARVTRNHIWTQRGNTQKDNSKHKLPLRWKQSNMATGTTKATEHRKEFVPSFSCKQEPVPTFFSVLKVHNAGWTSPASLFLVGVLYWKASCRVSAKPSSEIRLESLCYGHAMGKSDSTPENAVLIRSMDAMLTNSGNRFWKKICVALRRCWCPEIQEDPARFPSKLT